MEQWAEMRREHFVRGVSISELIAPLGFDGGKTIVDDYLREIRPFFVTSRTYQRTVYRPGEICQFDLWEPGDEIPVGHGRTRRGWVVVACSGYSRAGAATLIFSRQTPDLLFRIRRCSWSLGVLPQTLAWDRQSGLHASGGRPAGDFAAFCGALKVGWHFCARADPEAKGVVECLGFMEQNFEPGRVFANELDYQMQLDVRFSERANARQHKTLRCRPVDRLVEEREQMARLPAAPPDTDRRWVLRVTPNPYLWFDTCDYSLDPRLVAAALRSASQNARSWPSRWTQASWPAVISGRSPGTARSRRSSTPAPWNHSSRASGGARRSPT